MSGRLNSSLNWLLSITLCRTTSRTCFIASTSGKLERTSLELQRPLCSESALPFSLPLLRTLLREELLRSPALESATKLSVTEDCFTELFSEERLTCFLPVSVTTSLPDDSSCLSVSLFEKASQLLAPIEFSVLHVECLSELLCMDVLTNLLPFSIANCFEDPAR